ncbi:hypothetical protein AVEN_157380-1 [Araneus ventricosus]|uniref:Uncharacterized protein n=1 Tax=Araneus ventricosus TaxID=182803 RepID=A0A4Y2QZL2_ARAVE|nr:hypothetical protein AVEN_157380-1 [Araneus ventricosus]
MTLKTFAFVCSERFSEDETTLSGLSRPRWEICCSEMFSAQSWTDIQQCIGNPLWLRETREQNQDFAMECPQIVACGLVCPAPVTFLRERVLGP